MLLHRDAPQGLNLRQLADNASRAHRAVEQKLGLAGADFSLLDLIRSGDRHLASMVDRDRVARTFEVCETLRTSSGTTGDGHWVPFSLLTRDLMVASPTAGGALRTPTTASSLAASLAPASTIAAAGPTVITGLTGGALVLPRIDLATDVRGGWIGETSSAPQAEPTFASRVISPRTLIVWMDVSRRLLRQSSTDLEGELRRELALRIGRELDRVALTGDGVNEPAGLLSDPELELLSAGANGAAVQWSHLVALEDAITRRFPLTPAGNAAWITSSELRRSLRTTQRGTGLDFILSGGEAMGMPVYGSSTAPSALTKGTGNNLSPLILGAWSEFVLAVWGPAAVDVLVDGVTRGFEGVVRITARVEVGVGMRQPGAFAAYKDLK